MVDKVVKALDGLKNLTLNSVMANSSLRKEKMTMCVQLADQIAAVRPGTTPLSDIITKGVESLVRLCDDPDADVRKVADESLSRMIRSLGEVQLFRIQVDLFKEIKKNGPARSVRSALTKFAALCDRTRQTKGRAFAVNLAPCVVSLAHRTEESVHETLAAAMSKIFPVLGVFTNDNEVKNLIKAFLGILSSESAAIRRSSASTIVVIVERCRKPHVFFSFVLNALLDVVVPVSPELPVHHILGVLGCLRALLPLLPGSANAENRINRKDVDAEDASIYTDRLLRIYELSLHYLGNRDHNVITASLELLNLLLTQPIPTLRTALLNSNGIQHSYIHAPRQPSRMWSRSVSEMSVAMSLPPGEESLFDDGDDGFGTFTNMEVIGSRDTSLYQEERPRLKSLGGDSEADLDSEAESDVPHSVSLIFPELKEEPHTVRSSEEDEGGGEPSHDDLFSLTLSEVEKELDVGCFTDPATPLLFCCRRLSSFLLEGTTGVLRSDRIVRVSIKSLVLSCLSGVAQLSPAMFSVKLTPFSDCNQKISDVFLFSTHGDPQLRGMTCVLAGCYLSQLLIEHHGRRVSILDHDNSVLNLKFLLDIIDKGLRDSSPATFRLALSGLKYCLLLLLKSEYSLEILPLLRFLPSVASNSYWLNQVRLVEILSTLDMSVVSNLNTFQANVLDKVLLRLIGSEDARVRTAAANGLSRIIPQLCYSESQHIEFSRFFSNNLKKILRPVAVCGLSKDLNLFLPYSLLLQEMNVDNFVEGNLSRIIFTLSQRLLVADDKFEMYGILEALSSLSETFPPILYPNGWFCVKASHASCLLPQLISLSTSSPYLTDLTSQCHAISVIGKLYAGVAICCLKTSMDASETPHSFWSVFDGQQLSSLSEDILTHLLKLLNVYAQLQDSPITITKGTTSGTILHLIPSKKSTAEKDDSQAPYKQNPHYLRLHLGLKSAHMNYKTSLEASASDKLLSLLDAILTTLSTLLEMSTTKDSSRVAEEVLSYLRSVFSLQPRASIICVVQLLKSLFSVNLPYYWSGLEKDIGFNSLFCYTSQLPSEYMTERVRSHIGSTVVGKSQSGISPGKQKKPQFKNADRAGLATYVRLLEPMVIKALQMYTISSEVELQALVLTLLSQLIQLKVNYCLLDAEQTFITFVKKQFELIERGQIRNVEILLPPIFRFFVLLSYEKQHSKPIMSIPDILQLFVGLMASEQPKATHCVPGLRPVVTDILASRLQPTEDKRECETQREVLLSMLLRLSQYHQVLSALTNFIRADDQVASQVLQVVLPQISRRCLPLETLDCYRALSSLMAVIPNSVMRQSLSFVDVLFSDPPNKVTCREMARWLSGVSVLIETALDYKEDAVLTRISKLVHPVDLTAFLSPPTTIADPLLISVPCPSLPPAESLARLLLLSASRSAVSILDEPKGSVLLQESLSVYLATLLHLLMSGTFHETAKSFESLLVEETETIQSINQVFLNLSCTTPMITVQYLNLLAQLNYNDQFFWDRVLHYGNGFTSEFIKKCGVLAIVDYLCECTRDMETIEFLLDNVTDQIVLLSDETPIREFLALAPQRPEISELLLKALWKYEPKTPSLIEKTLRILEIVHMDSSGNVATFLINKFLRLPLVALSRLASAIACRRFEYLLTLPQSSILLQLPCEDFRVIFQSMADNTWSQRFGALSTLVIKLNKNVYKETESCASLSKTNQASLTLPLGERWYFLQIQQRCCSEKYHGCEMGRLLSKLDLEFIRQIMADSHFRFNLLTDCFLHVKQITDRKRDSNIDELPLFIASRECLIRHLQSLLQNDLNNQSFILQTFSVLPTVDAFLGVFSKTMALNKAEDIVYIFRLFLFAAKHIDETILNDKIPPRTLEIFLSCACSLLPYKEAQKWLSAVENLDSLNLALRTFFKIVVYLVPDDKNSRDYCDVDIVNHLVLFVVAKEEFLPHYLQKLSRAAIILICRIPALSNKALSIPDGADLQDLECLGQFVDRFIALGWTTRQQFEEIWAALLSGLGLNAESPEASSFVIQAIISSLEGIGVLLKSTLLEPFCGNPAASRHINFSRDVTYLRECAPLLPRMDSDDNFYCNLEFLTCCNSYQPGLLSVEYIWSAIQQSTVDIPELLSHRRTLADLGIDLTSCLHFLLDVFCQWKSEHSQEQFLLAASLKVGLVLSDLFTEPNQFRTLLDVVLDIEASCTPSDVPLLPLCILVTAKCCAAILPGSDYYERLKAMLCRSDSPVVRLAILQALLYLVEAPVINWRQNKPSVQYGNSMFYVEDNRTLTDLVDSFLPLAIECLLQFTADRCGWSENYEASAWALVFYLIQHYHKELAENREVFLQLIFSALEEQWGSPSVQNIVQFGVERLLLTDCLDEDQTTQILLISQHLLGSPSIASRRRGLQLLLTISYIGKRKMREKISLADEPEMLMAGMERVGALLELLKQSPPAEANRVARVLRYVLQEFGAFDVLTKLIQEFLSPHHPHPHILSTLLFQVLADADIPLLQDWIVLSLPSLTHGVPALTVTRTLTCLFLSACRDPWLRALFALVRDGRRCLQPEDRSLLCISATHFYSQLQDQKQKENFRSVFTSAAKTSPLCMEIVSSLPED